jgi:predicted permease
MGWREAARLSGVAFTEVALQATYAFRQGNPVPPSGGRRLVERSRRRVTQSKWLIAGLLGLLALGSGVLLNASARGRELIVPFSLPVGLYQAGTLTGLVGLEVVLLWWTGLQALPTYLGSAAIAVLETLPVDRSTLRKVALLVYLRLFDIPAVVVLVATPLFVGLALGPVAGLATVPASTSAVVFALALSLVTGRFFVRRVQGARGGGGGAVVRWLYLVLWLLPVFGLLAFVTASPEFFRAVASLASRHVTPAGTALAAVYPFSLALLPPLASGGTGSLGVPAAVPLTAVVAGAFYGGLAAFVGVWLYYAVADAGTVPPGVTAAGASSLFRLRPQAPVWAVLTKDLRLASRTPGYAFLILLPILDSVALGLVSYAGSPAPSTARAVGLGAVSTAALLATFFGPAFFALEVIAQSYGRTLPLAPRAMALGKVALVGGVYLAAGGIVLAITALRVPEPALFAAFVGAELPAVVAAGLLELTILFRWARARGLPVTNLYAGSWNILVVALPGIVLAGAPLATFLVAGLGGMAVVSVVELALVGWLALGRGAT